MNQLDPATLKISQYLLVISSNYVFRSTQTQRLTSMHYMSGSEQFPNLDVAISFISILITHKFAVTRKKTRVLRGFVQIVESRGVQCQFRDFLFALRVWLDIIICDIISIWELVGLNRAYRNSQYCRCCKDKYRYWQTTYLSWYQHLSHLQNWSLILRPILKNKWIKKNVFLHSLRIVYCLDFH